MPIQPTPTQEENDLAALGAPVMNKEPDGSPPDTAANTPGIQTEQVGVQAQKTSEPAKPTSGQYQTRTVTPAGTKKEE